MLTLFKIGHDLIFFLFAYKLSLTVRIILNFLHTNEVIRVNLYAYKIIIVSFRFWTKKDGVVVCCGVVWCGVVWCCLVWCGVVLCGVWCGVVLCGVAWYGVMCGVVWCVAWRVMCYDVLWCV